MMKRLTMTALALLGPVLTFPVHAAGQLSVEAQIASQIADRMPEGAGTEFAADVGQLHCWSRVTGGAGETIQHVWIHGEMEVPVSLQIGGTPWRTWSTKSIPAESGKSPCKSWAATTSPPGRSKEAKAATAATRKASGDGATSIRWKSKEMP